MLDNSRSKILKFVLIISNLLFLGLILVLAFNNRFARDDYYSIYMVNSKGIIDGVLFQYQHWCTRYFPVFLSFLVAGFSAFKYTLFLYTLLLIFSFLFAVYQLVMQLNRIFGFYLKRWHGFLLSVFLVNGLFYSTFSIGEVWFWLASNSTYLLSVALWILGVSFLLDPGEKKWKLIVIAILYLLIGASNETLSFFILWIHLILIGMLILIPGILKISSTHKRWLLLKLVIATFACLLSFMVLYFGPGNAIRANHFNFIGLFSSLLLNVKTTGMILLLRLPKVITFLIFFSIPAFVGGQISKTRLNFKALVRKIIKATIVLGGLIFFFQWPITYLTQDIGADRTLFPLVVLIFAYFNFIAYLTGQAILLKFKLLNFIGVAFFCILIFWNGWQLYKQSVITSCYAKVYEERLIKIQNSAKQDTIVLKALPSSGFLYSAEITTQAQHYHNKHLKEGLGIDADIILNSQ